MTKGLSFQPTIKKAELQNIVYTTQQTATVIIVHTNILHLYVPLLIPSPETQSISSNSIKSSFTLSVDSWTTDRRVIDTQLEYKLHIKKAHEKMFPGKFNCSSSNI